jgi:ribonuclease P protein component
VLSSGDGGRKVGGSSVPDGSGARADERLPRTERLHGRRQWQAVFREGNRLGGRCATLCWRRQEGLSRRAGFSAGQKAGPPVVRNRARRLLREAYRRIRRSIPCDCHLVFVARPGCAGAEYHEVAREMEHLLRRAGLWLEGKDRE